MKHKKYMAFKRGMDIAVSGVGLVIASPIMLLTAILIKIDSPGKVLFMQERIGKDGKVFKIAKFLFTVLRLAFRSISGHRRQPPSPGYSGAFSV